MLIFESNFRQIEKSTRKKPRPNIRKELKM